ncbi:hypothetical protein F4677DRAFT_297172 [Hypoxylon crocopeplum]|nr:hypothetical protein F4677DRAFT_297172 [Hypoxylon crocopeplum]
MKDTGLCSSVALVGVSCRLPGGSNTTDELWDLLKDGGEAWSPVPADRFCEAAFYHPSADDPNGTSNHPGGHFIDGDVRDFDHSFFHMSPQQASSMDPQQRILLEMSYEALENAGWRREALAGTKTAVFAAMFTTDFERNLYKDPLDLPTYYITGTEKAILANRISHVFDLRGPSITVDTGCSGGLVALHQACQSLRDGESDAAIVAAANITLNSEHHIGMSNLHLISSTGRSYPFDIRGDGYGRGEGFVVLVVKRLEDALRDRDPIRAVICSTAVNHDGYTAASISHPNGAAQADLIRAAYSRIDLQPQDVAYVEAHGTGTVAGDQEELAALAEVFTGPERSLPLYVGSIKGSIGHTENTSGLASLVKAVLILDRQLIPPVAGFHNPKPGLPLDRMIIPTKLVPLPRVNGVPSRVSVNSFGFGGTNAHAILERVPQELGVYPINRTIAPRLFVLSANSQRSLIAMLSAHRDWVEQHAEEALEDLSYSLCHRRSILPWRFSCVAQERSLLLDGLTQGLNTVANNPAPSDTDIIFVFTGQGAQWPGMGRELLLQLTPSPVFRDSIRTSRDVLLELGATWDLEAELLRGGSEQTMMNVGEFAQPVTTAVQIALIGLLRAQGVRPSIVIGHSSGEIAAAYAAGHLTHHTALRIALHRGFIAAASKDQGLPRGAMLSIGLSEREATRYTQNLTRGIASIACVNSPSSVTVSGDADAIDEITDRLVNEESNIFHRRLIVDTAYHSYHMRAVAEDYRNYLGVVDSESANADGSDIAFISSVSGSVKSYGFDAEYWISNLVSKVQFHSAIQALARHRAAKSPGRHVLFIEVGPHSVLAGPVRQSLMEEGTPKFEFDYYSALQRNVSAVTSALTLAGRLFEHGVKVDFDAVTALAPGLITATVRPDLPSYAWDHSTKHWHESRVSRDYRMRRNPYHDLLGVRIADSTAIEPRWRHMIGLATLPWLAHHVVDGLAIFPGSGYLCMAAEAVKQLSSERHPQDPLEAISMRDVSFLRALVVPDLPHRKEMQLSLTPQSGTDLVFTFRITALSKEEWYEHCTGIVEGVLADDAAVASEDMSDHKGSRSSSNDVTLTTEDLYRELDTAGNTYGPTFTGIRSLVITSNALQAIAMVGVPDTAAIMPAQHQEPHIVHPSTLDVVFHTALPIVTRSLGRGSVMPVHIDELLLSTTGKMLRNPGSELQVLAALTSSRFRAAHADISVTAAGAPVLSVSGIKMRSLAAHSNPLTDVIAHGICHELEWGLDAEYFRAGDLSSNPTLTDLVRQFCFKRANLSVLQFDGSGDLSLILLGTVGACGGTVASYDFVTDTAERFDETRKRLLGYSVRYRPLNHDNDAVAQGFERHSHDLVLASSTRHVKDAAILLKLDGFLVLVLDPSAGPLGSSLDTILREASVALEVQLTFFDATRNSFIVVVRHTGDEATQQFADIQIVTHTANQSTSSWATELEARLQAHGTKVMLSRLDASTIGNIQSGVDADVCIVVVDDPDQPILSDRECFGAVTALLKQPAPILWVSPDNPPSMHQITGVARTAHAENDKLRLTTVHAAPGLFTHNHKRARLLDVISSRLTRLAARNCYPHREREYRVQEDGIVLVPRLRKSKRLNCAIDANGRQYPDVELCRFDDSSRPLFLTNDRHNYNAASPVFIHDKDVYSTPLGDDEIEIEARALVLAESNPAKPLGEYAGVISRVGTAVSTLARGEWVVALGPVMGASRPRIHYTHAGRLALGIPPAIAAGQLLNTMTACHALFGIGNLLPSGTLLVHGALSPVGRSVIATARYIGARITAVAAGPAEARLIMEKCGVSINDVLISRRSLHRRPPHDVFVDGLDVIVQATEDVVPSEALACLKPQGCVVATTTAHTTIPLPKLPHNAALHSCDVVKLLQYSPDMKAVLVAQATAVLEYLPVSGLDFCIQDVAHAAHALQLIDTRVCAKVILEADTDSIVPAIIPTQVRSDGWDTEDASYVVAGGLGDLGRRLLSLMAHRGARHLVTLSRRAIDSDDYQKLHAHLEGIRPGCQLYCFTCDVTSESSIQNVAASLLQMKVPPVRGVIQSAAILRDRTLDSMSYDDFILARRIKVEGTLALEHVFMSPQLEFFLMLSSAVNIIGASGQANYNAGNAVQDAIAQAHCGTSCHFMSLSIGWIQDAAATADHDARLNGLRRAGLRPIDPGELSRYLDYALGAATSNSRLPQAIIGFDAISLSQATAHNGNIHSAMFCHVNNAASTVEASSSAHVSQTFTEAIANGSLDSTAGSIASAIIGKLSQLTFVDGARINERHGSILAVGLDSLVAIELRNWITREFHAPLQSSEIMIDQTVRALAEKVAVRSRRALLESTDRTSNGGDDDLDDTNKYKVDHL